METVCHLFDACGQFMARVPDTAARVGKFVSLMTRMNTVTALEPRLSRMVDGIARLCQQAAGGKTAARGKRKRRSMEKEYLRFLMYSELQKKTVEKVW